MEDLKDKNNAVNALIRRYKSKLFPYSYNILGDFMAAEDVVQEVLNNYLLVSNEHIEKPDSYLTRAVINKSINQKERLRTRKELYMGQWLPSPVFTEETIYSKADKNEMLNYSLLVILEGLTPRERAIFILKETFDYQHIEIAELLGIEVENSRQLLKRAKQKVSRQMEKPFNATQENLNLLQQLAEAIQNADLESVEKILSSGIQTISDGGNKVSAARNVLIGRNRVYKLLKAIYSKYLLPGTESRITMLNETPAIIYIANGKIYRCLIIETRNNLVEKIFIVVNPDKLRHLNSVTW